MNPIELDRKILGMLEEKPMSTAQILYVSAATVFEINAALHRLITRKEIRTDGMKWHPVRMKVRYLEGEGHD